MGNTHTMEVPDYKKEKDTETLFKEIITKNHLNEPESALYEAQRVPSVIIPGWLSLRHVFRKLL